MKNKITIFLALAFLSKLSLAQDTFLWNFSYDMKIKTVHFKTESNERNDFLKEQFKNILKENHKICANDSKDIKKEVKKLFPGCNFYYESEDNKFTSNISCNNLDYSISLSPKTPNDFRGTISLETASEEFDLKAEGILTLKRGKSCNQF